jgi:hypothetical protein
MAASISTSASVYASKQGPRPDHEPFKFGLESFPACLNKDSRPWCSENVPKVGRICSYEVTTPSESITDRS